MTTKTQLSDDLQAKLEEVARQQNRAPTDVLEEAMNRYFALCRLERFSGVMEKRAQLLGITEGDIPDLVRDVRLERQHRGC